MKRLALGFALGGCAALQAREDTTNFEMYCTNGSREEPLCSDIEARQGGAPEVAEDVPAARACCKTCRDSRPCGNSCISRSKTCHQPPGCAC